MQRLPEALLARGERAVLNLDGNDGEERAVDVPSRAQMHVAAELLVGVHVDAAINAVSGVDRHADRARRRIALRFAVRNRNDVELARRRAQIGLIEIHREMQRMRALSEDLLHADIVFGRVVGPKIRIADVDDRRRSERGPRAAGRPARRAAAFGRSCRPKRARPCCRSASRRNRRADRSSCRSAEVALIRRERIVNVARRIAVVTQHRGALRLRRVRAFEAAERRPG